jgi:ABC-type uncharacterized transport system ATPase subunit
MIGAAMTGEFASPKYMTTAAEIAGAPGNEDRAPSDVEVNPLSCAAALQTTSPTTLENAIQLCAVSKTYRQGLRRISVLSGVNLNIPAGQITLLYGPNGAGKTTLLRCLAGVASLSAGEVIWPPSPFGRRPRLA